MRRQRANYNGWDSDSTSTSTSTSTSNSTGTSVNDMPFVFNKKNSNNTKFVMHDKYIESICHCIAVDVVAILIYCVIIITLSYYVISYLMEHFYFDYSKPTTPIITYSLSSKDIDIDNTDKVDKVDTVDADNDSNVNIKMKLIKSVKSQ